MKTLGNLKIEDSATLTNKDNLDMWDEFFFPIYEEYYKLLSSSSSSVVPQVDYDILLTGNTSFSGISSLVSSFSNAEIQLIRGAALDSTSSLDWTKDSSKAALTVFLNVFAEFSHLTQNINIKTDLSIRAAEIDLGFEVDITNFMQFKSYLGKINRNRWTRELDISARQGSVSILGSTSERLLELAFGSLIDDVNFFKVNNSKVSSYGDFILMCLPNNLWLSVKSNFARERLLASGYSTDIIGAGFFEDKKEFTSTAKIRNFQRVGFLAMYIPDVPISKEQTLINTNTYDLVIDDYKSNNRELPRNINGSEFIRPLSCICEDMEGLLKQADISKRLALDL